MGAGTDNYVSAIALNGNNLYIGGSFAKVYNSFTQPIAASKIVLWNGATTTTTGWWIALDKNIYGDTIFALVFAPTIIISAT